MQFMFISIIGIVILLLSTVFQYDLSLANGLVMGKVFWFHKVMPFAACVALIYAFVNRRFFIRIGAPDLLLLLFFCITLLTYDWELYPEPEKLLFGGQLVLLWFVLRVVLKAYPALRTFFLVILLATGLIEAGWGVQQLYGYRTSTHYLFRLTGSFYNPGPYSGYLAVMLPVALAFILRIGKLKRKPWWHYQTVIGVVSWCCLIGVALVLPAGMSRSAWLAGIVSGGYVYYKIRRLQDYKIRRLQDSKIVRFQDYKIPRFKDSNFATFKSSNLAIFKSWNLRILLLLLIVAGLYGFFQMKKDSANGRLLMWRVTARAIVHQPLAGTGLGGFPAAFAEEQARYFAGGGASPEEKLVAGCPEYAFNEYLQIGLEQGAGGLLFFLLWLALCFYSGIRNQRIGAAGGLLALAVFACSSYPLQLPSFWVLLLFLSAICVAEPCGFTPLKAFTPRVKAVWLCLPVAILSVAFSLQQQKRYPAYKEWNTLVMLYNNKAYEATLPKYKELYPFLRHKPEFLFEYAQCLGKTGQYEEANLLLNRAARLSSDPMIRYMIARNEQSLRQYAEAEAHLLHAIDILPERIYPYYLLTLLYAEPGYYHPAKRQAAIDSVLRKEPKVHTTAIEEMREKVRQMLE